VILNTECLIKAHFSLLTTLPPGHSGESAPPSQTEVLQCGSVHGNEKQARLPIVECMSCAARRISSRKLAGNWNGSLCTPNFANICPSRCQLPCSYVRPVEVHLSASELLGLVPPLQSGRSGQMHLYWAIWISLSAIAAKCPSRKRQWHWTLRGNGDFNGNPPGHATFVTLVSMIRPVRSDQDEWRRFHQCTVTIRKPHKSGELRSAVS
jgi:hypothetical protein